MKMVSAMTRKYLPRPSTSDSSGVYFLRATDLARRYRIHIITVWKWTREGNLPRPARLGPSTVGWRSDVIEAWEAARMAKVPGNA
jgi:prophage regulatory protein